ncbi:HGGxSTG domain-containing protein [Streptomyces tendae]|uniref:HGGxSTG domain-containing protein n=1 Tax=Streptomyces tendae TaxID=1932 RepID=UPI0036785E3C
MTAMSTGSGNPEIIHGIDGAAKPCGAKTRNGGTCRRWPAPGAKRCKLHGGAIPRAVAAAERRVQVAERQAARADWEASYGELGDAEDPVLIMQREIQWAAGHVRWLRDRVRETEAEALVWGVESETEKTATEFPGIDTTYSARVHGWVRLYGQERDRLFQMIEKAARLGLDERMVRLSEMQSAFMFDVLTRALDAFGLDARKPEAATVIAGVVRAVTAERAQVPAA